jgi:hypothetical protein
VRTAASTGELRILTETIGLRLPDLREIPFLPGSATEVAEGGTGNYTWSLVSRTLPVGATLDPSGVIWGNLTHGGTFNITVRVSDGVTSVQRVIGGTINAASSERSRSVNAQGARTSIRAPCAFSSGPTIRP